MDNKISIDETNYLLDKAIWDKYDMLQTKDNVKSFLAEYKKSISISLNAVAFDTQGMTSSYDPNKVFSKVRSNKGGFEGKSNRKLDAQRLVEEVAPIITEVKKTFTKREKIYFDYCLAENYSETSVVALLDKDSRSGIKPISNSCILKIAFAFELEVLKK